MKIAIISDTHDNLANLEKALSLIKKEKIDLLIHCGDIFEPETAKEILKHFSGPVHLVISDADKDYFEKAGEDFFKDFPKIKIWKEFGEVEIDEKKIAFSHSPTLAFRLSLSQKYDVVFYGHLHKPWETKIKKTIFVNPGNIAGIFFKPSFAIYDTENDKLELKILN